MRNDVKLGFAIGGVLLAVLVVYVLVVPGSGAKKVALNSGKQAGAPGNVSLEPVTPARPLPQTAPPSAPPQVFNPGAGSSNAADSGRTEVKVTGAESADHPSAKPDSTDRQTVVTDPFAGAGVQSAGGPSDAQASKPAAKVNGPNWDRILNDQPTLIAQAPVKVVSDTASAPPAAPVEAAAPKTSGGPSVSDPVPPTESSGSPVVDAKPAPAPSQDPAAPGGGRIHTVQSGETFSSIAASAYGSANFYPAIMRANPNIDPQHLKPGMKINLPDSSQVKPSNSTAPTGNAAGAPAAKIDTSRQYRVQPGDSLYRIAIKLYGKGTYSSKLFELNQQAMGGDETRLRPGQLLQLPEPPTQPQQ